MYIFRSQNTAKPVCSPIYPCRSSRQALDLPRQKLRCLSQIRHLDKVSSFRMYLKKRYNRPLLCSAPHTYPNGSIIGGSIASVPPHHGNHNLRATRRSVLHLTQSTWSVLHLHRNQMRYRLDQLVVQTLSPRDQIRCSVLQRPPITMFLGHLGTKSRICWPIFVPIRTLKWTMMRSSLVLQNIRN
jgi:hypothetical protein